MEFKNSVCRHHFHNVRDIPMVCVFQSFYNVGNVKYWTSPGRVGYLFNWLCIVKFKQNTNIQGQISPNEHVWKAYNYNYNLFFPISAEHQNLKNLIPTPHNQMEFYGRLGQEFWSCDAQKPRFYANKVWRKKGF